MSSFGCGGPLCQDPGKSDEDADLDWALLIAAQATSAELESSVHLLWPAQETSPKKLVQEKEVVPGWEKVHVELVTRIKLQQRRFRSTGPERYRYKGIYGRSHSYPQSQKT